MIKEMKRKAKHFAQRLLKRQLFRESAEVSDNSMEVLKEFEKFEEDLANVDSADEYSWE